MKPSQRFLSLVLLAAVLGMLLSSIRLARTADYPVALPVVLNQNAVPIITPSPTLSITPGVTPSVTPEPGSVVVNAPFFNGPIDSQREMSQMAIFWFGQVLEDKNYADVRAGYTSTELTVIASIFDKRLWYNGTENGSTLESWDAVTLTLHLEGSTSALQPTHQSYRFVTQLHHFQDAANYQAAYRGSGTAWERQALAFTAEGLLAAIPVPNDSLDDRGWTATFDIPFASLGLSGPPPSGTLWRMSVMVHDRDTQAGPALPVVAWPDGQSLLAPASWGGLRFGLPTYTPPASSSPQTVTIREGLNGAVVPDTMAGGGTNCGEGLDWWRDWGARNYDGLYDNNVQNQMNLGDWPCYTKYYLSFPLQAVPPGKVIRSARLVLNHFGGSDPSQANSSRIQVLLINGPWNEGTLTWNNAPAYRENVSVAVVPVIAAGGAPANREWDLTRGVSLAYQAGEALNLVLYSADASMHSGKYFRGSEFRDEINRPTLIIEWGEP